jgi:integrase
MKADNLVFHSLRGTFSTRLIQAGVQEAIVLSLMGHAKQTTLQKHYNSDGYSAAQLLNAIHLLPY